MAGTRIDDDFEAWLRERIDAAPIGAGCWYWQRSTHVGYGVTFRGGRTQQAHRVVYEALIGPIPDGLQLDHLCRVRSCVNPDHCEPVTSGENTRRGTVAAVNRARARALAACAAGHPFTETSVYFRANGHRICKACTAERNRRRYA